MHHVFGVVVDFAFLLGLPTSFVTVLFPRPIIGMVASGSVECVLVHAEQADTFLGFIVDGDRFANELSSAKDTFSDSSVVVETIHRRAVLQSGNVAMLKVDA